MRATRPPTGLLRAAAWPGLAWGLCLPWLLTLDASRLEGLLPYTLGIGLLTSVVLHAGLTAWLTRKGVDGPQAVREATAVWMPSWIVGFAPLALIVPARRLPAFLAFVAVGLCLYRLLRLAGRVAVPIERAERLVFGSVFVVGWIALFQVHIVHDAFQYYGYLASIAIDGDLNLFDQIYIHNTERFYNPFPTHSARYIGTAVLEAPFFALGHLFAYAANLEELRYPLNGYSLPYRFFVSLASSVFGLIGILASYRLACELFRRSTAMMATLAVALASPLVFFMYSWGGWAHPFAFALGSGFLLVWYRTRADRRLRDWAVLGVLAGLLCLVRPTGGVIFLFPLVEWLAGLRAAGRNLGRWIAGPALGTVVALVVFSPQLALWNAVSGRWLSAPYKDVGDYYDWARPDFFGVLFSTAQHGLFVWTPLLLVATIGTLFIWRRDRIVGLATVATVAATFYVYACWSIWWSGVGFSNRFFIELTPLFVLGLAALVERVRQHTARELVWGTLLVFVVWNLALVGDYRSNVVPQGIPDPYRVVDEPLTAGELATGNLRFGATWPDEPVGAEWVHDGFVSERLAYASTFRNRSGIPAVLAAIFAVTLLASVLVRMTFRTPTRRAATGWIVGAVALTASLHGVIVWADGKAADPEEPYRFQRPTSVRPHGEDALLYSDYPLPVTTVDLVSYLTYAVDLDQGQSVAEVTVYGEHGEAFTHVLRAGIDTAEVSYLRPEYRPEMRHGLDGTDPVRDRSSHFYSSWMYDLLSYRSQIELPTPMVVKKIRIRYLAPRGRLFVSDVFMRSVA